MHLLLAMTELAGLFRVVIFVAFFEISLKILLAKVGMNPNALSGVCTVLFKLNLLSQTLQTAHYAELYVGKIKNILRLP